MMHMMGALRGVCDDEGESIVADVGKLSINELGSATALYMNIYEGAECYQAATQGLVLSRQKQRDFFLAATNPSTGNAPATMQVVHGVLQGLPPGTPVKEMADYVTQSVKNSHKPGQGPPIIFEANTRSAESPSPALAAALTANDAIDEAASQKDDQAAKHTSTCCLYHGKGSNHSTENCFQLRTLILGAKTGLIDPKAVEAKLREQGQLKSLRGDGSSSRGRGGGRARYNKGRGGAD